MSAILNTVSSAAFALLFQAAPAEEAQLPASDATQSVEFAGTTVDGLTDEEAAAASEIDPKDIVVERKICELIPVTGSIRPKRICRTRSQAEYDAEVGRETLRILSERRNAEEFTRMRRRDGSP